jgi:hypothetical protein
LAALRQARLVSYVLRQDGQEVRYVIDYYSAPPEPTGEPVFYLGVRLTLAINRPSALLERAIVWGRYIWERASGAGARRAEAAKKDNDQENKRIFNEQFYCSSCDQFFFVCDWLNLYSVCCFVGGIAFSF